MASIQRVVDFYINRDLNGMEIENLIGKPPILYSDLAKYSTIDDLLGQEKCIVILYQTSSKTTGHFVAISKNDKNEYRYFDSYGLNPDNELQYTPYDEKLPQYIVKLLTGVQYESNKFDYQSTNKGVSTCGRWASLACLFRNFTLAEFRALFTQNKDAWLNNPDHVSTILTLVALRDVRKYILGNK